MLPELSSSLLHGCVALGRSYLLLFLLKLCSGPCPCTQLHRMTVREPLTQHFFSCCFSVLRYSQSVRSCICGHLHFYNYFGLGWEDEQGANLWAGQVGSGSHPWIRWSPLLCPPNPPSLSFGFSIKQSASFSMVKSLAEKSECFCPKPGFTSLSVSFYSLVLFFSPTFCGLLLFLLSLFFSPFFFTIYLIVGLATQMTVVPILHLQTKPICRVLQEPPWAQQSTENVSQRFQWSCNRSYRNLTTARKPSWPSRRASLKVCCRMSILCYGPTCRH